MRTILLLLFAGCSLWVQGQTKKEYPEPTPMTHEMTEFWTPQPKVVTPGKNNFRGNSCFATFGCYRFI